RLAGHLTHLLARALDGSAGAPRHLTRASEATTAGLGAGPTVGLAHDGRAHRVQALGGALASPVDRPPGAGAIGELVDGLRHPAAGHVDVVPHVTCVLAHRASSLRVSMVCSGIGLTWRNVFRPIRASTAATRPT